MSIEYIDGSFPEDMPAFEALERFRDEMLAEVGVRALHLGSRQELNEIKTRAGIEQRLKELETRVAELVAPILEANLHPHIVIPTKEEIKRGRKHEER